MADMGDTEKMADEDMRGLRKMLDDMRKAHAQRVAPLYEKLGALGSPVSDNEREYARSIRRQIAQLTQSHQEDERPIVQQMVRIESMRLPKFVISRIDAILKEEGNG